MVIRLLSWLSALPSDKHKHILGWVQTNEANKGASKTIKVAVVVVTILTDEGEKGKKLQFELNDDGGAAAATTV